MNATVCIIGVMVIIFVVAILPKSAKASLDNAFEMAVYFIAGIVFMLVALSVLGVKPPF